MADTTAQGTSQMRQNASELKEQARSYAQQAAREAKAAGKEQLTRGTGAVATGLHDVSEALQKSADDMRDKQYSIIGDYIHQAARKLDDAAQTLQNRDPDYLISQTENYARRHPEVFIGGALALGFILGRMLKSSERRYETDEYGYGDDYAGFDDTDYYEATVNTGGVAPGSGMDIGSASTAMNTSTQPRDFASGEGYYATNE